MITRYLLSFLAFLFASGGLFAQAPPTPCIYAASGDSTQVEMTLLGIDTTTARVRLNLKNERLWPLPKRSVRARTVQLIWGSQQLGGSGVALCAGCPPMSNAEKIVHRCTTITLPPRDTIAGLSASERIDLTIRGLIPGYSYDITLVNDTASSNCTTNCLGTPSWDNRIVTLSVSPSIATIHYCQPPRISQVYVDCTTKTARLCWEPVPYMYMPRCYQIEYRRTSPTTSTWFQVFTNSCTIDLPNFECVDSCGGPAYSWEYRIRTDCGPGEPGYPVCGFVDALVLTSRYSPRMSEWTKLKSF